MMVVVDECHVVLFYDTRCLRPQLSRKEQSLEQRLIYCWFFTRHEGSCDIPKLSSVLLLPVYFKIKHVKE